MQEQRYTFISDKIPIDVRIYEGDEFVPVYDISIQAISKSTDVVLQKIRDELVSKISLGTIDITDPKKNELIEQKFGEQINLLLRKYFPMSDENTLTILYSYFIRKNLGLGDIEILMDDINLEEVVINNSRENVWVYHKKFGWLRTNIKMENEEQIQHYARIIARKSDKQITILSPLMDASLESGDRINATFYPVSIKGNTLTIRKFASKPWTITDFLKDRTISTSVAALIWQAIQFELSALVAGGTASGKTSMLNVLASFFPPNQRIISIEDTRELQLPKFLHWIPMLTRLPNPEGRGEVSMLDLLVNSLRMRPDRILVGEIRRHKEAEVLFEAIHTGHSVYSTVHANDTREVITRLTNPPIEIPPSMLQAISMIIVQYRNRRTGLRRTFQISEMTPDGTARVLMQLDISRDKIDKLVDSINLFSSISLLTGMTDKEILQDLKEKEKVLNWLVAKNIDTVDSVGRVMAEYYTKKEQFMQIVDKNRDLQELKIERVIPISQVPAKSMEKIMKPLKPLKIEKENLPRAIKEIKQPVKSRTNELDYGLDKIKQDLKRLGIRK